MASYDKILEIRESLWYNIYNRYVSEELFSAAWFFLIGLTIVSYIVWIKLLDKSRLRELLLIGSLVAVCMGFLDVIATTMILWSHKVRVLPGVPSLFATDYTLFPVIIMIAHQFSKTFKRYMLWSAVGSGILSFVFFPFYVLIGTMKLEKLNYLYIFIIVYIISLVCEAAYLWVSRIEQRNGKD